MNLGQLMRELALGELSNLSFVDGTEIVEDRIPSVILAVNTALRDLFTRLPLRESEVIVQTYDWKTNYPIRKEHAMMDDTPNVLKYIQDTPARPFTGDLVKIVGVCNEIGAPLPINDAEGWASVFLPAHDTVQFNHPGASQVFAVQYQALHPVLADDGEQIMEQPIHIPAVLIDLLKMKVALTLISPMAGQEHSLKAQVLESGYESKMDMLERKNEVGDLGTSTNIKLHLRGYP